MKHKDIIGKLDVRFKGIKLLAEKLTEHFDEGDIMNFRKEIKKLRAFLRLLNFQKRGTQLKVTYRLKTFYNYTGIVRDIQLHKIHVNKYVEEHQLSSPHSYLEGLENEELYWQKQALEILREKSPRADEKKIMSRLPCKLGKTAIKHFVRSKINELKIMCMNPGSDDTLHSIRKLLKDLLYTRRITRPYCRPGDLILQEQQLREVVAMLGDYMNLVNQLGFLEPVYVEKINNPSEREVLKLVKDECLSEKASLKSQILSKLVAFHAANPELSGSFSFKPDSGNVKGALVAMH